MLTKDKIKTYIDFFEDENQVFYNFTDRYISYHKTVDMFIEDCYNNNMMDTEYMTRLKGHLEKNRDLDKLIATAELMELKAILTFYIRGERFNEGMMSKAIDDKIFLNILKKLI